MADIYYIIISTMEVQKTNSYSTLKYWFPPIIWAGLIFTFSSLPTVQTTKFYMGDFLIKKTAHIIEYGILAILVFRALVNSNVDKKKSFFFAIIIASIYGITDEFHQSFTPGRGPAVRDVAIDMIGATIGVNLWKRKS